MRIEILRPGPEAIEPDRAPGGVVLHAYSVPDGALLVERLMPASMPIEAQEQAARDDAAWTGLASRDGVCLVAYDGDTGARWDAGRMGSSAQMRRLVITVLAIIAAAVILLASISATIDCMDTSPAQGWLSKLVDCT